MKVIYVAGPYRAPTVRGIVENIRNAEAYALELWKMGYAVICPHMNSALLDGACPDEVWLEGDIEILSRCDVVFAMPGSNGSKGAAAELAWARRLNITVLESLAEAKTWVGLPMPGEKGVRR